MGRKRRESIAIRAWAGKSAAPAGAAARPGAGAGDPASGRPPVLPFGAPKPPSTMASLRPDRRLEPRFRTAGRAVLRAGRRDFRALVLDLSLQGLRLSRPAQFDAARDACFPVMLAIGEGKPLRAEVQVMHEEPGSLGVSFVYMPPSDFGVLAGLIEHFERGRKGEAAR